MRRARSVRRSIAGQRGVDSNLESLNDFSGTVSKRAMGNGPVVRAHVCDRDRDHVLASVPRHSGGMRDGILQARVDGRQRGARMDPPITAAVSLPEMRVD